MNDLTPEQFFKEYEHYIRKWFQKINSKTNLLDEDEFLSSFMQKVLMENTLEKYIPGGNAVFTTWLYVVLLNHYYTLLRKVKRHTQIIFDSDELESAKGAITETKLSFLEWERENTKIDHEILESVIEDISNVKHRIVVKLKFYNVTRNSFSEDEILLMAEKSGMKKKEVCDYIDTVDKSLIGLKEKDIAFLTGLKIDSIGGTVQRCVRKVMESEYKLKELKR